MKSSQTKLLVAFVLLINCVSAIAQKGDTLAIQRNGNGSPAAARLHRVVTTSYQPDQPRQSRGSGGFAWNR